MSKCQSVNASISEPQAPRDRNIIEILNAIRPILRTEKEILPHSVGDIPHEVPTTFVMITNQKCQLYLKAFILTRDITSFGQ